MVRTYEGEQLRLRLPPGTKNIAEETQVRPQPPLLPAPARALLALAHSLAASGALQAWCVAFQELIDTLPKAPVESASSSF